MDPVFVVIPIDIQSDLDVVRVLCGRLKPDDFCIEPLSDEAGVSVDEMLVFDPERHRQLDLKLMC